MGHVDGGIIAVNLRWVRRALLLP